MKKLATLTLSSLCLLAALTAARAQVSAPDDPTAKSFAKAGAASFYDASKDETGVYVLAHWLTGLSANRPVLTEVGLEFATGHPFEGVKFTAYFTYPGKTYAAPRQVMLRVASTKQGGHRFYEGDRLSVLADGRSLGVGVPVFTSREYRVEIGRRGAEYMDEMLDTPLSLEDFNRLVAAKKVELKVGGESWKLGQTPLKALRRLAEAIGEAK
jgi:hypothetical protein